MRERILALLTERPTTLTKKKKKYFKSPGYPLLFRI